MKKMMHAKKTITMLVTLIGLMNLNCDSTKKTQYSPTKDAACLAAEETYNIYVDSQFSKEELKTVLDAIDEWERVFNGCIKLEVINTSLNSVNTWELREAYSNIMSMHKGIMILSLWDNDEINNGSIDNGTLAYVNAIGSNSSMMVVLRERIAGRNFHKILLHELGHIFGAKHSSHNTLMYAYYGEGQIDCVERETALQVANHFGFDVDKLNYCAQR